MGSNKICVMELMKVNEKENLLLQTYQCLKWPCMAKQKVVGSNPCGSFHNMDQLLRIVKLMMKNHLLLE